VLLFIIVCFILIPKDYHKDMFIVYSLTALTIESVWLTT